MIYCLYYSSSSRTKQGFEPFCVLFTSGHVKSCQKTYCLSQRINSALSNAFIPTFLKLTHTWKKHSQALFHRTFEGPYLLRNFSERLFNTRKKHSTIPQKNIYKVIITAKRQPSVRRAQSSTGGEHAWHCSSSPSWHLGGKPVRFVEETSGIRKGHWHQRCFLDVESWCIWLPSTGFPMSWATLPFPIERYFHPLITSHF